MSPESRPTNRCVESPDPEDVSRRQFLLRSMIGAAGTAAALPGIVILPSLALAADEK